MGIGGIGKKVNQSNIFTFLPLNSVFGVIMFMVSDYLLCMLGGMLGFYIINLVTEES